ncbi:MAG: type I 3-dehydroquinate dehydratase [Acidobacteriota bacterium]
MKLIVTILEETHASALAAIRMVEGEHDGVELRAENLGVLDLAAVRKAVAGILILTHRGRHVDERTITDALEAGVDLVDVEYHDALDGDLVRRYAERIVLSHHDYEETPDVDSLLARMQVFGSVHTKIAVTPHSFRDNQRILETMRSHGQEGVTLIGMGARGLYSRIAAPFFGSKLQFVAPRQERSAAPGQLTLDIALQIYGDRRTLPQLPQLFAVVGNPAGHSLSPTIHNPLFREAGVAAAYTICDTDSFDDIVWPFAAGAKLAPAGLSITAPFKDEAFAFAKKRGATIGANALESSAVNTLVRISDREMLADNTDVDGFESILEHICGRDRKSVAVLGAGGTARAALVALRRAGMHVTLFNRSLENARLIHERVEPLDAITRFDGEVVVNTLPAAAPVDFRLRPGMAYIEAAYGPAVVDREALEGVAYFDGIDLLLAQAVRQNALFLCACMAHAAGDGRDN